MSPIAVLLLMDHLRIMGGAERSLYLLAGGLKKKGHKVIVCCLKGGQSFKQMQQDGFLVEDLNVSKIYNLGGLKAIYRIMRIAKQERVSIIMSYHDSSDFLGLLIAILAKIPIVSSRRDMGFNLKARHIWTYRLVNRFFDHIATVSSMVKEYVVKIQRSEPSDITVIPNGVEAFSDSDYGSFSMLNVNAMGSDEGLLRICCLANIRPIKGHRHLVDAAKMVVKQFPQVRFYFAGCYDSNDSYYTELEKRIQILGLQNKIIFTGGIPRNSLQSLFSFMDISVLPSLSEGMSNTLLESMSAAKPVVATAVGGNLDLVEDGKTGFLVPPCDSKSLAEALLKLLIDAKLRRQMGLLGKSRVMSEFSVTKMVDRYEELFQRVLMRNKAG